MFIADGRPLAALFGYLSRMFLRENLLWLGSQPQNHWYGEFAAWEQWIQGRQAPHPADLLRIADLAGLPVDHLLRRDLAAMHQRLQGRRPGLILLDVDGTLTDGGMYYSETGDQIKRFQVKDGIVIHRLIRRQGVQFGLVSSGSAGNILHSRAQALGIQHVYFGTRPKLDVIQEWLDQLSLGWVDLAYVGDDLNDLPVIEAAGIAACPADAVLKVRLAADVILQRDGGQGCVREFLEEILGYEV